MIKFFTNKELSLKLGINLAKWKRWSREFLPPDPLGGMQSGYTRQYNPDDAFTVYLGGLLVADLKFTIPEAKQILNDLDEWLIAKGFYFIAGADRKQQDIDKAVTKYNILIMNDKKFGFYYTMKGIISNNSDEFTGFQIRREQYTETSIFPHGSKPENTEAECVKILNITVADKVFVKSMGLGRMFSQNNAE